MTESGPELDYLWTVVHYILWHYNNIIIIQLQDTTKRCRTVYNSSNHWELKLNRQTRMTTLAAVISHLIKWTNFNKCFFFKCYSYCLLTSAWTDNFYYLFTWISRTKSPSKTVEVYVEFISEMNIAMDRIEISSSRGKSAFSSGKEQKLKILIRINSRCTQKKDPHNQVLA